MLRLITWFKPYSIYLLVVWSLLILSFSSIPSLPALKIHTAGSEIRLDYIIHFCEYGILSVLTFLSFAGREYRISVRKYLLITLILILFAVLDELHQKFVPGRSFNVIDLLSNISGIFAALLFCMLVFRKIKISRPA